MYPSMHWADSPPPGQTQHPPTTATAADGTHPTGMHSCFYCGDSMEHISTPFFISKAELTTNFVGVSSFRVSLP